MNLNQIEFLRSLDPDKQYGTLQRLLHEGNLQTTPFENVAKVLLHAMMQEREMMMDENTRMRKALEKAGLYNGALLGLEG